MMGVYIKGMEMPTSEPLIVKINPDGTVSTTWKNGYKKYEAVPIPPHGRLIDADAELKKLNRICLPDDLSYTIGHDIAKQFLKDAPTIIPASEEGET